MKTAIEVVSIVIIVTLGCMIISSIITSSNQTAGARDFYNVVVNRIEDSNYNSLVVQECIEDAKRNGYILQVEDVTIYEENPSKLVTMEYTVSVSIFKLFGYEYEKQAVIEGYAM